MSTGPKYIRLPMAEFYALKHHIPNHSLYMDGEIVGDTMNATNVRLEAITTPEMVADLEERQKIRESFKSHEHMNDEINSIESYINRQWTLIDELRSGQPKIDPRKDIWIKAL